MAFKCPPELLLRNAARAGSSVWFSHTAAATSDKTYTVAVCKEFGKPLEFIKKQQPQLLSNQVRLQVKHAAINFADILMVEGKYQVKPPVPFQPGSEFSAEVLDVGPQVSHVKPGDHVVCVASDLCGAFAQETVTSGENCFRIDQQGGKSLREAAALIVSYGTAQLSLVRRANIKSSDIVLVTAAAGALGLAAVDLAANVYGATVIGACGGAEKCILVKKYGAKFVIDYNKENLRDKLKEITKGRGVNIIFDVVGGKALEDGLKNIAYEGRVLTLGYASGDIPKIPANILLVKNFSVIGVFWGSYRERIPEAFKESVDEVIRLWSAGKIKPHVSESFPLTKANEAIAYIRTRQSTGKVILNCIEN